jgi:hypothetical protein
MAWGLHEIIASFIAYAAVMVSKIDNRRKAHHRHEDIQLELTRSEVEAKKGVA